MGQYLHVFDPLALPRKQVKSTAQRGMTARSQALCFQGLTASLLGAQPRQSCLSPSNTENMDKTIQSPRHPAGALSPGGKDPSFTTKLATSCSK
jgi:hypothetical protein